MRSLIITFFIMVSFSAKAKLLDKIIAVINDTTFTQSQVERVINTQKVRKEISPQLYAKDLSKDSVVELFLNRILIRQKLKEIGYIIGDDQVEAQIKQTEKRLGLNRASFLEFLSRNGMNFDEYFEIIRETIEYNIFISRIIHPLISITEQEIKNAFFKKHASNKTFTFKYNLVDFTISKSKMNSSLLKNFQSTLETFQVNGVLPEDYKSVQTNVLGEVTEEFLTKNIIDVLKNTEEGKFSNPLLIGDQYHVFFVKKKDLMESEFYNQGKNQIKAMLFGEKAEEMIEIWFKRESNKHYIKKFI